jgi:phage terminase small subunit
MMTGKLTIKQQRFLELYLDAEPGLSGNATRAYRAAYGCTTRAAGASGDRLLKNAVIVKEIAAFQEKLQKKMEITAESVLVDSVRMRDIAFGDKSFTVQEVLKKKDPEGNEYVEVVDVELKRLNPQMLGKALELMGRNCVVQAFIERIDVSHTHILVERLNERTKKVTAAAEARKLRLAGGTDVESAR